MTRNEFNCLLDSELRRLFQAARQRNEFSFLFAILGINSGEEDFGWQPINETYALAQDVLGLLNGPLHDHAKARMALFLYCHIIEANFIYHCVYNMFLTIEGLEPPKVFSFLDKYKNGVPPSVSAKLSEIKARATDHGFQALNSIFDEIIRPDIRNAFFHSDYILFDDELRLKHRGWPASMPLPDVFALVQKTVEFFEKFMVLRNEGLRSFPRGYVITGRKSPRGHNLADVNVLVDEGGLANGFSVDRPLPLW
jgi:hypothetical protein